MPQQLYDGTRFLLWREQLFGAGLFRLDWIYPPPMIAVAMAFCRIPLLSGYILWGVLICVGSVWALRRAGLSWPVVLLGLFGPPTWRGITSGQYAPLAASLVMAGLLQSRRAPIRSGLQIALATLKPHLGILVPVVWLAQRRWAAFAVASVGTLVIAGGTTALLGAGIWPAFLRGGGEFGARAAGTHRRRKDIAGGTASVFWMARSLGAPIAFSYAAQAVAALIALLAAWLAARRGSETGAATVAACLTLLVSPYLYYSDLVGYSIVVAMLAERRPFGAVPIFLWLFPGISESLAVLTGVQVLPVCVAARGPACLAGVRGRSPRRAGAPQHRDRTTFARCRAVAGRPRGCPRMIASRYPRAVGRLLLALIVLIGLAAAVATLAFHLWAQWHDGPQRVSSLTHTMPEGDYSLLWSAGRMAAAGRAADVYDGPSLLSWREQLFGPGWSRLDWMYPPPMIALGMAVSAIPLLPGYLLWLALTCAASIWALRGAGLSWRVVLFGLFGPPTWLSLALGQYAPLAASFVVAGLLEARRRPVRAGLHVALATLKPHLGILVPVVWVAQRRWRAFAAATVGTLALVGVSTALFGLRDLAGVPARNQPVRSRTPGRVLQRCATRSGQRLRSGPRAASVRRSRSAMPRRP